MLEQFFWNMFEKTGSVDAYLGVKDCCNCKEQGIVSQEAIQNEQQCQNNDLSNEEMW